MTMEVPMTPQQMRYMADEMYRRAHINECWDFLYSSGFKPVPPNVVTTGLSGGPPSTGLTAKQ